VPSGVCRFESRKIESIPTAVWESHELFIGDAAEAKRITPHKASFSEGVLAHLESLLRMQLPRPIYLRPPVQTNDPELASEATEMPELGIEGQRRLVAHFKIERDRKLVEAKKKAVLERTGGLSCEVCSFDFRSYKDIGDGFCEVHHLRPLSEAS